MKKLLKAFLDACLGRRATQPESPNKVDFQLKYGQLVVGVLSFEGKKWRFHYSDDFKKKDNLSPLTQFPDKQRVYEDDDLWPFFAMRIPSLKQPAIKKIVREEHIDADDRVELLRRFGRRTVANPYELTAF